MKNSCGLSLKYSAPQSSHSIANAFTLSIILWSYHLIGKGRPGCTMSLIPVSVWPCYPGMKTCRSGCTCKYIMSGYKLPRHGECYPEVFSATFSGYDFTAARWHDIFQIKPSQLEKVSVVTAWCKGNVLFLLIYFAWSQCWNFVQFYGSYTPFNGLFQLIRIHPCGGRLISTEGLILRWFNEVSMVFLWILMKYCRHHCGL